MAHSLGLCSMSLLYESLIFSPYSGTLNFSRPLDFSNASPENRQLVGYQSAREGWMAEFADCELPSAFFERVCDSAVNLPERERLYFFHRDCRQQMRVTDLNSLRLQFFFTRFLKKKRSGKIKILDIIYVFRNR